MPYLHTDAESPHPPVTFPPPTPLFTSGGFDPFPPEPTQHIDRNRPPWVSTDTPPILEATRTEMFVPAEPTFPSEQLPSPAAAESPTHKSQIATAALVGIIVALGVVFVGALFALIWMKRKRDRQRGVAGSRSRGSRRGGIVEDGAEKAPPTYEAAVYGTDSDSDYWNPQDSPEAPILQSPPPTHQGIIAPRPISTNNIISLRRLDTITTSFPAPIPQQQPQPRQPEIIVFPHDSPILAPENDDALSLRAALRMSQNSNRVLSSQSRASGRFTENFDDRDDGDDNDDAVSVVSDLREDERAVETEIV